MEREKFSLQTMIHINCDYPTSSPVFFMAIPSGEHKALMEFTKGVWVSWILDEWHVIIFEFRTWRNT